MQVQLVIWMPEQAGMLRKASRKTALQAEGKRHFTRDFVTLLGFSISVSFRLAMLLDTAATTATNTMTSTFS